MNAVGVRRRRDDARLVAALPEALERLASGSRAGEGIVAGLERWAAGVGPLADDMRGVLNRMEAGETLGQSLARWPIDRPLPQVRVTCAALQIASTVGGRSAAALDGLATALRDAEDSRAEVLAQSAQARLSALVIGLAPAGAIALTALMDPRTPTTLFGTGSGRACLAIGLFLMATSAAWMARILRFTGRAPSR